MRKFEDVLSTVIRAYENTFNSSSRNVKSLLFECATKIYIKEMELEAQARLMHQTRPLAENSDPMQSKFAQEMKKAFTSGNESE